MSVGKYSIPDNRSSVSLWRVYLPVGSDRSEYINNCFLTGSISIINENAEIIHRVKIGKLAIQLVDFPLDEKSLGSEVLCASVPYSRELRVIDVYSNKDQFYFQDENQFRLLKNINGESAEIVIDGKNGKISLSVDSDDNGGEINVSVTNKNRSAKFNLNVNGDIVVVNDGKIAIQSSNSIQLEHYSGNEGEDKTFVNISKEQVKIESKKILLNESDEPVILGNKLIEFLEKLMNFLTNESAGPYPLTGKANYEDIKKDFEGLKSKLSFVK